MLDTSRVRRDEHGRFQPSELGIGERPFAVQIGQALKLADRVAGGIQRWLAKT